MTDSPQQTRTAPNGARSVATRPLALPRYARSLTILTVLLASFGSSAFARTPQSNEPDVRLTAEEAKRTIESLAACEILAVEHEILREEARLLREAAGAALVAAQKYEAAAEQWKAAYEGERELRRVAEEDAKAARKAGKVRAIKWGAIALGVGLVAGSVFGN